MPLAPLGWYFSKSTCFTVLPKSLKDVTTHQKSSQFDKSYGKVSQVEKIETNCQISTKVFKSQHKLSQFFKMSYIVTICHKYLQDFKLCPNCSKVVTTCLNCLKLPQLKLCQIFISYYKYLKVFMFCHKLSQLYSHVFQGFKSSHSLSQLYQIVSIASNCLNMLQVLQVLILLHQLDL